MARLGSAASRSVQSSDDIRTIAEDEVSRFFMATQAIGAHLAAVTPTVTHAQTPSEAEIPRRQVLRSAGQWFLAASAAFAGSAGAVEYGRATVEREQFDDTAMVRELQAEVDRLTGEMEDLRNQYFADLPEAILEAFAAGERCAIRALTVPHHTG